LLDVEPPPQGLSAARARFYGYSVFSARYGNIYVVRHLLQLVKEAFGEGIGICRVWHRDGRFYDAMRPTLEPEGLDNPDEVIAHRKQHLENVRRLFLEMDVLVFTLGLTEAWVEKDTGLVLPTCPGVVAGTYDPEQYEFRNFGYSDILAVFLALRELIRKARATSGNSAQPEPRYVLTVSPVPLVATATGGHVLPATVYSKSILRAVAGELAERFQDIDYFPPYEIIAGPWSQTNFYGKNLREVTAEGVETVMNYFFRAHGVFPPLESGAETAGVDEEDDIICDEVILDALGK
jgi:hypothetical protein